jgi:LmbE family N-acetylglucosaminyl deacetylase
VRILAVGAHLDDVEIGCGGAVAKAADKGHQIKMLVLSDSTYADYEGMVYRTIEEAQEEGPKAAGILGVAELEMLDFPTKDVPHDSSVVESMQRRIDRFRPDVIFTHWPFDTHQAHRNTGLSTLSAGRYYTSLLMYEPMMPAGRSYMGFRPQVYVDISDHLERKLDALRAHASQLRKYGDAWLEAVESRCRLRGFEMGVRYAEAFEAVRFEWQV